jgi:hypothetical protein
MSYLLKFLKLYKALLISPSITILYRWSTVVSVLNSFDLGYLWGFVSFSTSE